MLFIALGGLLPLAPPDGIRVGVADVGEVTDEAREAVGPLAPSRDRFPASVDTVAPLARTLLPNADLVADVSALRSFTVLPASDMADGGLDPATLGVPKMEDSRR